MSETKPAGGECQGVPFTIDSQWQFCALDRRFDSYNEMADHIEKFKKAEEVQGRRKLELPAIHNDRERTVITGLHAGHGGAICKPKLNNGSTYSRFYPDVPWLAEALREQHELQCRVVQLDNILKKFVLDTGFGRFATDKHAEIVDKLAASHATRTKAAEATTLEEQKSTVPMPSSGIRF